MSKIRVGIAGANGAFGSKHMDAISAIEDAEVTAVTETPLCVKNTSESLFTPNLDMITQK